MFSRFWNVDLPWLRLNGCASGPCLLQADCKAKHEHRERQANPPLFSLGDSLQSEWPDEDDKRNREDPQAVVKSPS